MASTSPSTDGPSRGEEAGPSWRPLDNATDMPSQGDEIVVTAEPDHTADHANGHHDVDALPDADNQQADDDTEPTPIKRHMSVDEQKDLELRERYQKRGILSRYLLEIVFMLYVLPTMILMTPMADLFIQKACLYVRGYNQTICHHLDDNKPIKENVQIISNQYSTMKNIVGIVPGAATSLIAGQYMSRYGIKWPLIFAIMGTLITTLLQTYTFYDMEVPLVYNVLAEIPGAITGGLIVFMTAVYTNITVSCPSDRRKGRFLMIQFFIFLPMVAAMALGGILYSRIGIFYLSAAASVVLTVPFAILLFFFQDFERSEEAKSDSWLAVIRHSAGLRVLKQSFSYLARRRADYARAQLYCMFTCLMVGIMAFSGASNLNYVYMNLLYDWDVDTYSEVNSISMTILFVLSIPTMLLFSKVFKLSDPAMIAVGFACYGLKFLIFSVVKLHIALFYIQLVIGLPFIVSMVGIRAHMSRLIAPNEIAVIFSLTSAFERLVPIGADAVTMLIYNKTVHFFPGLVFAIQGVVFFVPTILAILCTVWTRRYGFPEYQLLDEEQSNTSEGKLEKKISSGGEVESHANFT